MMRVGALSLPMAPGLVLPGGIGPLAKPWPREQKQGRRQQKEGIFKNQLMRRMGSILRRRMGSTVYSASPMLLPWEGPDQGPISNDEAPQLLTFAQR